MSNKNSKGGYRYDLTTYYDQEGMSPPTPDDIAFEVVMSHALYLSGNMSFEELLNNYRLDVLDRPTTVE